MTSNVLEPPISNEGIISKGTLKKHSIQSLIDNSDSEFEMFHHKSSKTMKSEKSTLNKSIVHDISGNKSGSGNSTNSDTDFADNELAVFSKGKTQETVKKSQPEAESIRKYLISTKPPSTSSSSSDDTLDKPSRHSFQSEFGSTTSKNPSESIRSPNKDSSQSIKSSPKGSSETSKSPSKSSSGSSKRSSETIKSPSKGSSGSFRSPSKSSLKSIELNKNPHSLSDDDEIIPASQNLRSSLQFDLSSGQLDKSNSRLSQNSNENKSTDSENSSESSLDSDDSSLSDTEKASTPHRHEKTQTISINHNETWLSEFLGKAINATSFTNKKSGATCLNKITDDEDLFLIQCPEEIDPRSFKDKNIILNGNTSISLNNDGEFYEYDYCAVKDNMERYVNLVIPKEDLTRFRLGQVCISGSVLLTESIAVPKLDKPPPSPLKKVQYPEKLETLCSSLPAPDAPSVYSVDVPFSKDSYEMQRHKHKGTRKKKRKRESSEGYISDHENISTKNVKETLEDSSPMPPTHSHKKKKRRKDCELPDFNNDDFKPEDIRIKIEPKEEEEETPEFAPVKKKKKKSKTKDSLGEYYSEETFLNVKQELLEETLKQELDVPVMKKKKKKRKSSDEYIN